MSNQPTSRNETTLATALPGAAADFADVLHRESKTVASGQAFSPAIVPTSVYALSGAPQGPYQYARWSNPGWSALEEVLGALEGARSAIFPSGSAAIAALFAACLRAGDRVLLQTDGYMGTRTTANRYFAPQGICVETCSTAQLGDLSFEGVRLVLLETPSNPGLELVDIRDCAQRVHASGGLLVIDNTLMTPLGQAPLDLGADATVYSDTKLINGHSDAVFGHVSTRNPELLAGVLEWRRVCGAIPGPFETWMVQRGLETLEVRLARMHANALALAQALTRQGGAQVVCYPGLASHAQHALAKTQMNGYGCLVGLTLPSEQLAEDFVRECRYLRPCTSFGGVHSSAERRARWGDAVAAGFLRLSVGCEPTEALCRELLRALELTCR
jgi:cystathionine gamma-lyase